MFSFNLHPTGLGTIISFLSFLIKGNVDVQVNTMPYNLDLIYDLKKALGLNFDKIKFVEVDPEICRAGEVSDWGKIYARYLNPVHVNFNNILFSIKKHRKPMVALSCYRSNKETFNNSNLDKHNSYPYNRQYPIEVNALIWSKLKEAGYDVLTIDDRIPVVDKCFLLNEYCDALVGYEGGLTHLAHCLGIPTVIFPFRFGYYGDSIEHLEKDYTIDKIHLDSKTFIVDKMENFLELEPEQFKNLIDQLHENKGNNRLIKADKKMMLTPIHWKIQNSEEIFDFYPDFYEKELAFMSLYFEDYNLGGGI